MPGPTLNIEELEEQAVAAYRATLAAGDDAAQGPRKKVAKKGGKGAGAKAGAKADDKKKPTGSIESELNVYGIGLGAGVAAFSVLMRVIGLRLQFGEFFGFMYGGYAVLFVLALAEIVSLAVGLYVALLLFEQRYPLGNVLIIAGLIVWVPVLPMWIPWNVNTMVFGIWVIWLWKMGSIFAIYKGLLETENEGMIMGLIIVQIALSWLIGDNIEEAAQKTADFLQNLF